MSDREHPSVGLLQWLCGVLLYVLAAVGGLFSISVFVSGQAYRKRHADTGDFTGATMVESFVIMFILPLTVCALIGAWNLVPMGPRRPAASNLDSPRPPGDRTFPVLFAIGIVTLAIAYLAYVARLFSPQPLPSGVARWIVFSPSILMALGLVLVAWRVARSPR